MLEFKARSEVFTERLDAVSLGGMMARGDVRNARLAREMHRLLGDFTRQIGIDSQAHGVFEITLRRAGAPGDPPHDFVTIADDLRRAIEACADAAAEFGQCWRLRKLATRAQSLRAERVRVRDSARARELHVVADVGMSVERQMIGKQVE